MLPFCIFNTSITTGQSKTMFIASMKDFFVIDPGIAVLELTSIEQRHYFCISPLFNL